jgi:hypothetical protein
MCVPFVALLALLGCVLAHKSFSSNVMCSPQGGQFDQRRSAHYQYCVVVLRCLSRMVEQHSRADLRQVI